MIDEKKASADPDWLRASVEFKLFKRPEEAVEDLARFGDNAVYRATPVRLRRISNVADPATRSMRSGF